MSDLKIGDTAPDFSLPLTDGRNFSIGDATERTIILYFYPKDDTKGCTVEAIDFSALVDAFKEIGAIIIGVSPDSLKSHAKFQEKHNLTVALGADENHSVATAYGAWKEKSMYGKKYMGIERSTFVISANGKLCHIWRKVKAKGHAQVVLDTLI